MFDRDDEYNGDYIRPSEEYRADCTDEHEHGMTYENHDNEQHYYDSHNEAESEFAHMLISGEHILWAGKSKHKFGLAGGCAAAPMLFFAFFWLGFSVFWTFTATLAGGSFGLFGLFFIFIGIMLVVKSVNPGKKVYAITNMRVLRKEGKRFKAERLDSIKNVTLGKSSGNLGYITYLSYDGDYYTRNGRRTLMSSNLMGIENCEEVYRILNEAIYMHTHLS